MDIIFHGGMHKTGTTFVQSWLTENSELLVADGLLPITTKTIGPFRGLFDAGAPASLSALVAQARLAGVSRILVSHEAMSWLDGQQLALLARSLPDVRTSFIASLRHWNGFLPSRWQQNARRVDTQSFARMLARLRAAGAVSVNIRFDFLAQRILAANFDSVRFICYDSAAQAGTLLPTFLEAAGITPPSKAVYRHDRLNESQDIQTSDVLRLVNGVRARFEALPENPLHDLLEYAGVIERFFDHGRDRAMVDAIYAAIPELIDLVSQTQPITLREHEFQPLASRLEFLVMPHLVNPTNGRLFPQIADRTVWSSQLEVDDIPDSVVSKILQTLQDLGLIAGAGS